MILKYLISFLLLIGCLLATDTNVVAWEGEPGPGDGTKSPLAPAKTSVAKFNVDFRVAIMAPAKTRKLRVWVPLPPSTATQVVTESEFRTFPREHQPQLTREPTFGNAFAYFEIDSPDGALEIQHTFAAEIAQLDWDVDYSKVANAASWPQALTDPPGLEPPKGTPL